MKALAVVAATLTLVAPSARAFPITIDATGSVTAVFAPDAFGTTVGDLITLHATFDSNAIVDASATFGIPGLEFASLASPGAALAIDVGSRHWTELDEPLFGSDLGGFFPTALPHVVLLDHAFFGLNYFGIGPGDDVFVADSLGALFFGSPPILGGDSNPDHPPAWIGAWDLEHATVRVPEPGTFWLLLFGAAAMASSVRRLAPAGSRRFPARLGHSHSIVAGGFPLMS